MCYPAYFTYTVQDIEVQLLRSWVLGCLRQGYITRRCPHQVGGVYVASTAFYINLLIGAVCAPVSLLFLIPNIDPRKGAPLTTRLREIDWLGSILNLGAFLSGVMAILTWAWGSGRSSVCSSARACYSFCLGSSRPSLLIPLLPDGLCH